jgi:hypothetical protein
VRPAVFRDQVGVLGVIGDPAAHERAVGQHGQAALPGGVEAELDDPAGKAAVAEVGEGLGVQQRELAVVQPVVDEPGELAVGADLEPLLLRMVGDLQLHDHLRCPG